MADISVNGWIAEGGHTIIEGKKNNIILFDVVENLPPISGIDDDIYKTNSAAAKIYKQYGKESIEKVQGNPYCLADDIWGIGFKTADGIAEKLGYEKNDLRRCRSGILYTLSKLSEDGHVYSEREQQIKSAKELLQAEEEPIIQALDQMIEAEDVILEEEAIFFPPFYYAEVGIANKLKRLQEDTSGTLFDGTLNIEEIVKQTSIQYDDVQVAAIGQAVKSKVMVLTGG